MTDDPHPRGAAVRAVRNTARWVISPTLDALAAILAADTAPRWIGVRRDETGIALRIAPSALLEALQPKIAETARGGYVLPEHPTPGAETPRVGPLRDDPGNDARVQEIDARIDAALRKAIEPLDPGELICSDRDQDALRRLLDASRTALPGVDVAAPCTRVQLATAEDSGEGRDATALVFLLDEVIDLKAARSELLHAVGSHRERSGVERVLLGSLDPSRFDDPAWQLRHFLEFLLGRGLSRVHADVGLALLARVAAVAESHPRIAGAAELVEYVRRVHLLRETFDLDDPIVEDHGGIHRLADYVRTIRFVRHLPLALLHDEQRFERRGPDAIVRRITFRARLNATRPTSWGESPIEQACCRFEACLDKGDDRDALRSYRMLLPRMLGLVLLDPQGVEVDAERFRAETHAWSSRLQQSLELAAPRRELVAAVRAATTRFERARGCFLEILRKHHVGLLEGWSFGELGVHLAVRSSLFDPRGDATRPLREEDRRAPTDDFAEAALRRDLFWLSRLHVSTEGQRGTDERGDELTGVMVVRCRLALLHLRESEKAAPMKLRRDVPARLLQVILAELPPEPERLGRSHLAPVALPRRIVVGVPPALMQHPKQSKAFAEEDRRRREREDGVRWAVVTLVTHLALRALLRWAQERDGDAALPAPHAVILRAHRSDGRGRPGPWSFTPGEALTACGRALEQALGASDLVAGVTSQGVVLAGKNPADSSADFRIRAANWATTSRWPLQINGGIGRWSSAGDAARVGVIAVASRPLHDGQDRHLVLGETALAGSDGRDGFTLVGGVRITEIVEGDPAVAMLASLRAQRNRLRAAGCGLVLLLTHRHGSQRIGRLREFDRLESSDLLDAMRRADGEAVTLCPISYGVCSAVRLRNTRRDAAKVFVLPESGLHDQWATPAADSIATDALIPFFSVATFKLVGDDRGEGRPQSGLATYALALSSTDARVRSETEHAVRSPRSPWHGRIRDVLLASHFFVTEQELRTARGSADPRGFMAVLAPHESIATTEAADVGEFAVWSTRGRRVRVSLAALLADVHRAVEPAR